MNGPVILPFPNLPAGMTSGTFSGALTAANLTPAGPIATFADAVAAVESGNTYANLHTSNRFRVKPNTITYIGDIRIALNSRRIQFFVRDGEPGMQDHLNQAYPTYMKSMGFEKVMAEIRL